MIEWNNKIVVPIIAVVFQEEDLSFSTDFLPEIMTYFKNEDYNCIACLGHPSTEHVANIYCLNEYLQNTSLGINSKLKLIFNIDLPDILIIGIGSKEIDQLKNIHTENGIDILVCINDANLYASIKKSKDLCDKALLLLSVERYHLKNRIFNKFYTMKDRNKLNEKIKKYLTEK
jgi:hypothetical protein